MNKEILKNFLEDNNIIEVKDLLMDQDIYIYTTSDYFFLVEIELHNEKINVMINEEIFEDIQELDLFKEIILFTLLKFKITKITKE